MVAVPWQLVLLSPLGITLTVLCVVFFLLVWLMMMKTPAITFLKASFGQRMILINPDPDKRMVFRIAKKDSDMMFVKKRGYYIVDPNHAYIESSSKLPCAITYGSFAESIDPEGAELAEKLKGVGINNYIEVINHFYDELTAEEVYKKGIITKEEYDGAPNKLYRIRKKGMNELKIFGKSVPFDNIINYFSKNTRADLIESKIQHRISAIKMEKLNEAMNLIKWAVFIGIVFICAALAYNMIITSRPTSTTTPPPSEPGGIGGIIGQGVDAISGGTTGIS